LPAESTHRVSDRHVVVLGAGFGGLSAIRELRRRDEDVRITLLAPRAELHYLPGRPECPS
jgi:sulfide:quinone oxidoreductase